MQRFGKLLSPIVLYNVGIAVCVCAMRVLLVSYFALAISLCICDFDLRALTHQKNYVKLCKWSINQFDDENIYITINIVVAHTSAH